jgi:colicin import membrane protein
MKTTKKPSGKASTDLRALAAAAKKRAAAARKRARLAKAKFKQARKAWKQAKKAAKAARKQAKAAAKALKAKARISARARARAAKRAKDRGVATVAVPAKPVSQTTAPGPLTPETASQTSGASAAVPPAQPFEQGSGMSK